MTTQKDSPFVEKYLTPIAVLLGAIIIAVAFAFGTGGTKPTTDSATGTQTVDIKNLQLDSSPIIGSATAPVTMAVWFDYQCPFCKRYDMDTVSQIYTNYVVTGKVKIVLKDFQFLGDDSQTASVFARALWEAYPDKFYTWFQAMMNAQDDEGDQGFGDLASIKALTATIPGIDVAKVEKLMNDKKAQYQAAVAKDRTEGGTFGINGTPGTLIGTKVLSGAVPYSQVSALLDAELKK